MIHVITGRKGPESPVYVVEPLQGTGRKRVLHRNLLLPCPYLVKEPEVSDPNLREKDNGNKTKRTVRRNLKTKYDTDHTGTDSSSEEEYQVWTSARQADPPLNAEAQEFYPGMETPGERPEEALILEENPEVELEEERPWMEEQDDAQASEPESEDEQRDAETEQERPRRARQARRIYTYDQLGQPTLQLLRTCTVNVKKPSRTSHDLSIRSSFMYPFYKNE